MMARSYKHSFLINGKDRSLTLEFANICGRDFISSPGLCSKKTNKNNRKANFTLVD